MDTLYIFKVKLFNDFDQDNSMFGFAATSQDNVVTSFIKRLTFVVIGAELMRRGKTI